MYTYRISITSDIADIEGTFSQEEPLTYGDFTREIRALRVEVLANEFKKECEE